MKTFVALLRGINVGGHKKILMADLKLLLENIDLKNVQAYIQSGNVIFHSNIGNTVLLEQKIKEEISRNYGFDVSVLVRTNKDFKNIIKKCPFKADKKVNSYFIILHSAPEASLITSIMNTDYPNEEFYCINTCVYIFYSGNFGKAKCTTNFFEKKLKVSATARNYKTMKKLVELSS